jgi:pimeloyl-ACP methyl ester carboxylesterase
MSRDHAEAARAAGDAVELVVVPGAGHAEMIDPESCAWQAAAAWLETAR